MIIRYRWLALLLVAIALTCNQPEQEVNFFCHDENDFYQLLKEQGYRCHQYDDINIALANCHPNSALFILATEYPFKKTVLPENFYSVVRQKNLRVFVEFPDRLSSGETGPIKNTKKERLVCTDADFTEDLPRMSILDAGLFAYISIADRDCLIAGANVAGFDKAIYGLDSTTHFPILFKDGDVLVSLTKFSDFNKSRYSPIGAWEKVLKGIVNQLSLDLKHSDLSWEPMVKPTYQPAEALPDLAYKQAVERGAEWYLKGRFLIHPDWQDHWKRIDTLSLPVGPPIAFEMPSGNGTLGVMEGHYSYINPNGSQPYRYWLRADCVSESAMTLSMAHFLNEDQEMRVIAGNLMDFLFNTATFKTPQSQDHQATSYGLMGWADTHPFVYYGDDNARVILGAILAGQMLEQTKWDKQLLELILANFRTAGKNGFRGNSLRLPRIEENSWQILMEQDLVNPAPHYESWLWATYLWLYDKTQYRPLLDKAKRAIEMTMQQYPDGWTWTNGIQQERARMILPLAWLIQVEDIPQHHQWLELLCDDLLKSQVVCGALREELGVGNKGKYGAPESNEDYGQNEAPVIHNNGDPVADMLYTSNFAFFALHEAAAVTQNPKYEKAVDQLADFLVRIQSTSTSRPDLDGCWFRAFDYEHWEYYGSNADHGWGAWGTLTGWTQSFIATTLALMVKETSYWELTKTSKIGSQMDEIWSQMLPGINK